MKYVLQLALPVTIIIGDKVVRDGAVINQNSAAGRVNC
ncbi:hypothetical protein [Candidatus Enterococcus lemimoniae]|nr:hypothetical protein [Enterococcus sp. 12C11_DIV0727]